MLGSKRFSKWTPRPKTGKGQGKGQSAEERVAGVVFYNHWPKWLMKAYPDVDGSMLNISGPATDFFKVGKVRDLLDSESAELVARPALGVSMACASVASMAEAIALFPELDSMDQDARGRFEKTGLPQLWTLLSSSAGQECLSACTYLNNKVDMKRGAGEGAAAMQALAAVFGNEDSAKSLAKGLAKAVDASSRIYAGSIAGLQLLALLSDPKAWVKKVPSHEKQPRALREWLKDPKSMEKLGKALSKIMTETDGKKQNKKKLGESASESESRRGRTEKRKKTAKKDSSSSDSDTDAQKKAKKIKKVKKETTSSSDSDTGVKKKFKKARKGKKEKKGTKSSSDSDAAAKKKEKKAKKVKKAALDSASDSGSSSASVSKKRKAVDEAKKIFEKKARKEKDKEKDGADKEAKEKALEAKALEKRIQTYEKEQVQHYGPARVTAIKAWSMGAAEAFKLEFQAYTESATKDMALQTKEQAKLFLDQIPEVVQKAFKLKLAEENINYADVFDSIDNCVDTVLKYFSDMPK